MKRFKHAVVGKGPCKLRKRFEKYYVNDYNSGQITPHQRLALIKEFHNVCMIGKCKDPEKYSKMFEKVMSLVMNDGLVLETPGATDGSYIVAGSVNRIFCVSSAKGRSFKCDGSCINSTTKICEHVLGQ